MDVASLDTALATIVDRKEGIVVGSVVTVRLEAAGLQASGGAAGS